MTPVFVLFTVLMALLSDIAFANDPLQDRYSVVGVISESKDNADGIVMLLDRRLQKNLILKSGQALISDPKFHISEVMSNSVVISNGAKDVVLSRDKFAEPVVDNEKPRSGFDGGDDFGVPRYADEEAPQGRSFVKGDDAPPFSDEEDEYIGDRQAEMRKRFKAEGLTDDKRFRAYREKVLNRSKNRKF